MSQSSTPYGGISGFLGDDDLHEDLQFLVDLAAKICQTQVCLVTVLSDTKQYFVAKHGVEISETPLEYAFCAHAVTRPNDLMIVEDATKDDRFKSNPLVTGEPNIRFYAGAPITGGEDAPIGTLCVIDTRPGSLSQENADLLHKLSRQVSNLLSLRKRTRVLEHTRADLEKQLQDKAANEKEIQGLLHTTSRQNQRLLNFAHIVSHNLRSHTYGLSGMLSLMKMEDPEVFSGESGQIFETGLVHLQATLEDLTEVVQEAGKDAPPTPLPLARYVERNVESLRAQINEAGVSVQTDVPEGLMVMGIAAYLDSIVLNLITNAIKYRDPKRKPVIGIQAVEENGTVRLSVADNGLGIDMQRIGDKVFSLHSTFHQHKDARGIGLYITRIQVEQMHGTIEVDSTPGAGSTFTVTLPAAKA